MADFIPGLRLSAAFYTEVVQPLLAREFPQLVYSAGLLGYGSDVMGFDTPVSMDHEWGPRMLLFLDEEDFKPCKDALDKALREHLPATFYGHSTHFSKTHPVQWQEPLIDGPINHKVRIVTVAAFTQDTLGWMPSLAAQGMGIGLRDWLAFPQQKLLEMTAGQVFHDGLGALLPLRARLRYYPPDVWRYLLAAQWHALAQEEAFLGRTGAVGDDLGSRMIAARQVQRLMLLAFLMARQYAPYSKWFGSAFAQLPIAAELGPTLADTLAADEWQTREQYLGESYITVARYHNALKITAPQDAVLQDYFERPYRVLSADRFAEAIVAKIQDEQVRALPIGLGGIDQLIASVDGLCEAKLSRKLQNAFYSSE